MSVGLKKWQETSASILSHICGSGADLLLLLSESLLDGVQHVLLATLHGDDVQALQMEKEEEEYLFNSATPKKSLRYFVIFLYSTITFWKRQNKMQCPCFLSKF